MTLPAPTPHEHQARVRALAARLLDTAELALDRMQQDKPPAAALPLTLARRQMANLLGLPRLCSRALPPVEGLRRRAGALPQRLHPGAAARRAGAHSLGENDAAAGAARLNLMVRRREAPSRTMRAEWPPHPSRRALRALLRMRRG